MTIVLLIVTSPKPPGSRQLISPPLAVLEIAPAKVLQGAVRLHGLASSPTPDTQVRVAWAWAGAAANKGARIPRTNGSKAIRRIINLLGWGRGAPGLAEITMFDDSNRGTASRASGSGERLFQIRRAHLARLREIFLLCARSRSKS